MPEDPNQNPNPQAPAGSEEDVIAQSDPTANDPLPSDPPPTGGGATSLPPGDASDPPPTGGGA